MKMYISIIMAITLCFVGISILDGCRRLFEAIIYGIVTGLVTAIIVKIFINFNKTNEVLNE